MDQILPGLYLGNAESARNLVSLQENKISHILVAGRELKVLYADVCEWGEGEGEGEGEGGGRGR